MKQANKYQVPSGQVIMRMTFQHLSLAQYQYPRAEGTEERAAKIPTFPSALGYHIRL
jgi:hypothetical protein